MITGSMTPANLLSQPDATVFQAYARTWQGIPSIERTRGGRTFVTLYSGMETEQSGNFVVVLKSDDQGASWTDAWLVVQHDDPAVRCFDACLWIDPLMRLWLFWAQSGYGQFDGRVGVWASRCDDPDAEFPSFHPPQRIANGIMLNKPTVTQNGEWLLPCSLWGNEFAKIAGPGHPELANEVGANVYVSKDQGVSFERRSCVVIPGRVYDEHSIVELTDGTLWLLGRCVYGIGQAYSRDGGYSWERVGPSGHTGPNSRFHIRRLRNGDLLLINHVNPTNAIDMRPWKRRDNLMAMLSKDEGKSWIGGLMLDARNEVSYPDAIETQDGRILAVYDHERYNAREILMATFTPDDILAGAPVSPHTQLRQLVSRAGGSSHTL